MRLIDADALEPHEINDDNGFTEVVYMDDIREMPTIEAEPVKHAKLILLNDDMNNYYVCSNCKHDVDGWINYCPHCGAKMDGETT